MLKVLGVSLAGALTALVPGQAGAKQPRGNDECAHFCSEVFPPGRERGECTSAAAQGEGVCFECGPLAPQPRTNEPCNGQCFPLCAGGQVRNLTTCQCEVVSTCALAGTCTRITDVCPGTSRCYCFATDDGTTRCPPGGFCVDFDTCISSADCPSGTFCALSTCCGVEPGSSSCCPLVGGLCLPECGDSMALATASSGGLTTPPAPGQ